MIRCFAQQSFFHERAREVRVRAGILRPQGQHRPPFANRAVDVARLKKNDAEIVMAVRIIGTQTDRFAQLLDRFMQTMVAGERIADAVVNHCKIQTVMALRAPRADRERLLIAGQRLVYPALLHIKASQIRESNIIAFCHGQRARPKRFAIAP